MRNKVIVHPRKLDELREAVCSMRLKMLRSGGASRAQVFDLKSDLGGITDIEFMVQYAVLANAGRYPAVSEYTDNVRQLESLKHTGAWSASLCDQLTRIYLEYRSRSHDLALQDVGAKVPDSEFREERKFVIESWEKTFGTRA